MLLGTTYLLEGFVRVQTRAGVPQEKTALVFGNSRIPHSEPSVCATLALLVGRVLRCRTPRVPPCFAGPQLELWAVRGDPDTTTGAIWLGFTSASRVTAPCVFHRHSERRHADWLQLGSGLTQYVRIPAILAAAGAWGMVSSSFDQAE